MDDIAGLLQFLRLEPFDHYDTFRDYILMPLERGYPTGVKRLRTLVDSFTLRRVKGTVKLPQRTIYTKYVELDSGERQLHDEYLQQSKYFLDKAINIPGSRHAKTALEIILGLRLICDHGGDLLPSCVEAHRALLEEDIKAEIQQEIDPDQISNPITLYQEYYCQPSQPALSHTPSHNPEGDSVMIDCSDEPAWDSNFKPRFQSIEVRSKPNSPRFHKKFPDYRGPSSKIRALLAVLQSPKEEWKHSNGPIKR